MKVTLGGPRLGQGNNKMQVQMHGFGRSTHNLSYAWRSTIAPGTVVPFINELVQTGDTFEINLNSMIYTNPTNGPMYGSFNMEMHLFACPLRLYNGALHSNTIGVGKRMNEIIFPKIAFTHVHGQKSNNPLNNTHPSSLLHHLGLSGIGQLNENIKSKSVGGKGWTKFGVPLLCYWDIIKNYIVNKQEDRCYFINGKQEWQDVDEIYLGKMARKENGKAENENVYIKVYPSFQAAGVQEVTKSNEGVTITNGQYIKLFFKGESITEFEDRSVILKSFTDEDTTNAFMLKNILTEPIDVNRNIKVIKTIPNGGGFAVNRSSSPKDRKYTLNAGSIRKNQIKPEEISENYIQEEESMYVVTIPIGLPEKFIQNGKMKLVGIMPATDTKPELVEHVDNFPLENLEAIRKYILKKNEPNEVVLISEFNDDPYFGISPLKENCTYYNASEKLSCECPMQGLALKPYKTDINNAWLNKEFIEGDNGINEIASVSTTKGSFSIDTFNLATKVYNMLNRIAASDGTYTGWQRAVYGQKGITLYESPMYLGGASSEIVFEEVVSNSESETRKSGNSPLGSLAGRGTLSGKNGGYIRYKAQEDCIIMGLVMITPRIDYSQRNKWIYHGGLETYDDMHKPSLDRIGYQDLLAESLVGGSQVYDANGNVIMNPAIGKTIAWINYMTNVNECHGEFADENKAMFMTLNRNYEIGEVQKNENNDYYREIQDVTTYINPKKFNYIFADSSLTAQNFQVQIGVKMNARRVMAAKQIPAI